MIVNFTLIALVGILVAAGVYLILDRAITRMLMGLMLMGNGINLLILATSGPPGAAPLWGRGHALYDETADPVPQAFVLTAIVIMMGTAAFILALAYRQHRHRAGDRVQDDREDRHIARRRADDPSAAPDHDRSDDPATGKPTEAGDRFGPDSFEKPVEEDDGDDD
ncbi:Na(+)/H(+) antiporter subunit C [Corynebacterium sp.]|uniref:Na(+)/H(+) antiporter subunit C n=1 Tax=Corynebacterium sp. TaxID=1720 RepID=UPI0026DDC5C1|nr:Na(+)/H(+) antiporter subunit C [Corynebacterium sp.]MDO4610728.1 Na(+)/H(+) antiporter subunit C [Corynebacterium sp.]